MQVGFRTSSCVCSSLYPLVCRTSLFVRKRFDCDLAMIRRSCEVYILIWPVWWHTPTDEEPVLVPHFGAIAPSKVV